MSGLESVVAGLKEENRRMEEDLRKIYVALAEAQKPRGLARLIGRIAEAAFPKNRRPKR